MSDIKFQKIPEASVEEVKLALDKNVKVLLLDVRTPEEYKKSHIAGSISMPLDNVFQKVTAVFPDKKQKIFVYCLSGFRSAQAVKTIIDLGYASVYTLSHGLLAWRSKGYALQTKENHS